jgi:ADP-heptose:LPS heptosyltransferase/glycosyltransferase involved in cell wall biosynthesis
LKKALIIQNKFIGDVLVSSVLAKNLKKIFPNIEIHFFCYNNAIYILENNPYIDKIIGFDDMELKKLSVLWEYTKYIKNEKYDILFDPYAKLQSRFITLFSNAKRRISFDKPFFKYFYTDVFVEEKFPKFIHCTSIENRCLLLSPFVKDFTKIDFQTEIFLTNQEIENAKNLMIDSGISFTKPIIVVGILGSSLKKSWPLSYMAELINYLSRQYDIDILFNYIPNQHKEADALFESIECKEKIFTSILGNNIREFAAILFNSNALIANEGGAVNIAKAIRKPSFSIFSPHKFRKDWGCYENLLIHKSFHLMDVFPEIYTEYSLKEILRKPEPFYKLMNPKMLIGKIEDFLQHILGITKTNCNLSHEIEYKKTKITALCITYNEEENVDRFMKDISFADEIIVVDSFSTDKTKDRFKKYSNVIFIERKFDNFTNQKNFAIEHASHNWIVFFDLDEHIPTALINEILITVNSPNSKDAYWIRRNFYFKDKLMKHSGWKNDKVIRLFKKDKSTYKKSKFVHEEIECTTEPGYLKNRLDHYSFNSEKKYLEKLDKYSKLKAKELFEKGIKSNFMHHYIKPIYRFIHHYIIQFGFIDGKEGYAISKMYAKYVSDRYKYLDQFWKTKTKKN